MTRYLILEPGEGPSGQAVFLRDRFHPVAFLLPFVWLAAHRLYLFSALALLVQAGLFMLGRVEGFGLAASLLLVVFGIAVALEGPRLVAARLRAKGFREAAVIHAAHLDDAELLYFGTEGRPASAGPVSEASVQAVATGRRAMPILGWRSARSLLDAGAR